jgi:hypothetical protein
MNNHPVGLIGATLIIQILKHQTDSRAIFHCQTTKSLTPRRAIINPMQRAAADASLEDG